MTPLDVLPFSENAARAYAELRARLEAAGMSIGPMDMLITAQALSGKLVLVTNNVGEFTRAAGLRTENWTV